MAVMLKETIGRNKLACQVSNTCTTVSDSHAQLARWKDELFGSVPRSMFTVFRCFTDGCVSMDGTPLPLLLWDVYGIAAITIYVICTMLVIFGIFNLIAAIFVENTLENSKLDEDRRQHLRSHKYNLCAMKLQKLMTRICYSELDTDGNLKPKKPVIPPAGGILTSFYAEGGQMDLEEDEQHHHHGPLHITPRIFKSVLGHEEVVALLEDLDISSTSALGIWGQLDADGNGQLGIGEIVAGLVKLRDDSKKIGIETLLAVRAMQKTIRHVEAITMRQQQHLLEAQKKREETLEADSSTLDERLSVGMHAYPTL